MKSAQKVQNILNRFVTNNALIKLYSYKTYATCVNPICGFKLPISWPKRFNFEPKRCSSTEVSKLPDGPSLKDFIKGSSLIIEDESEPIPYLDKTSFGQSRKVYFDIYGCQMNVNDTEIIWSILRSDGFLKTTDLNNADVVLVITCAIRDGAESKIWNRIDYLKGVRNARRTKTQVDMKIGILGCMAERLKHKLLEREQAVDLVAGPDSYKDLPRLLALTENNQKAVNVLLSLDETYADITPVRLNQDSVTAFVSIMRGCDNMCTYCIVPFTRGRERSRPINSIVSEVEKLVEQGVKEVTLLGQNVNSYRDITTVQETVSSVTSLAKGFKTVYKQKKGGFRFADLLNKVADVHPELRVRFTSPHPKDFPDEVLEIIRDRPNVCKNLHLPAQSGNSAVLERMRRGYTREAYLELVFHIRDLIPSVALSSDFICGFCGETDAQFDDTLSLMRLVGYNNAFLFPYSMREKTTAHRRYEDNVPDAVKRLRLEEMVKLFRHQVERINQEQIGMKHVVLVEGDSRRSKKNLMGRNDNNIKVIFPKMDLPTLNEPSAQHEMKPGDYVVVQINAVTSQVLKGIPLYHTSISDYYRNENICG